MLDPSATSGRVPRGLILSACVIFAALAACGGSGGSATPNPGGSNPSDVTLPDTQDNFLGTLRVIGAQLDGSDLLVYAHGTHEDGEPITLDDQTGRPDFGDTVVRVDDVAVDDVTVQYVEQLEGDPLVISTAIVSDYSHSLEHEQVQMLFDRAPIIAAYEKLLEDLPRAKYEGFVLNFSSTIVVREEWTRDAARLREQVQEDMEIGRFQTRLYDALAETLDRRITQAPGNGVLHRCQPVRLIVLYTDGADNAPDANDWTYRESADNLGLLAEAIDQGKVTLATLAAFMPTEQNPDHPLFQLAGDRGVFVHAITSEQLRERFARYTESLTHMVVFRIPATVTAAQSVTLAWNGQEVPVDLRRDLHCELP
jgi:hypothetical protein